MSTNVDYCGVIFLLKQLVDAGYCTTKEANRIASRIGEQTGAGIILSL